MTPSSPGSRRPASATGRGDAPGDARFVEEERPPRASAAGARARAAAIDDDDDVAKAASEGNRRRRRLQEDQPFHEVLGASESIVERLYVLGYASKRRENHEPPLLRTHFALSGAGINLPPVVQWADCMNACLFLISLVGGDAREVGGPRRRSKDRFTQ